jgi:hypothetical protein
MINTTISINGSIPINNCQPCNIDFYDCLLNTTSEINIGGVCLLNKHNVIIYTLLCISEGIAFITTCLVCCLCFKKEDKEYIERMELLTKQYNERSGGV